MMGCSTTSTQPSPVVQQMPAPPADLAVPCPGPQPITDGSRAGVALWVVDEIAAHRDCAARHQALVDAWSK
ncbi:Rz1-like lysis system protein LysC [Brachymonas sp. J145]|uniref:Rz1-like lysis system protein LysC n=1 Tax=Brachymonas sp. J145 TaxID=3116489 RepID=UPI003FA45238